MALAILVPASVLAVPVSGLMPDGDAVPHPKPGDGRELVERHWTLRAIVGSLSGGMMMALNFSFDTLFFVIAIPAAISAVMLTLLTVVVRLSISVPDDLPRASVVNE